MILVLQKLLAIFSMVITVMLYKVLMCYFYVLIYLFFFLSDCPTALDCMKYAMLNLSKLIVIHLRL